MLTKSLRFNYSPTESKLLSIIRSRKSVTTSQLTEKIYEGRKMPFNGKIFVNSSMRNLIKKIIANGEHFRIKCTREGHEYAYRYQP